MTEPISLRINGKDITADTPDTEDRKLTMLLWSPAGHGKTQLAETAPGDKLWLMFDPGGADALKIDSPRGYNHILRLYEQPDSVVAQFKNTDPLGIEKMLADRPEIGTIVFDSLTTFSDMALSYGVAQAKNTPKGRTSTIEDPGYAGYGHKKTYVMEAYKNMLRLAARTNRHIIFTAHEDKPETNDKGEFVSITLMLGSSLVVEVPVRISEIWHVTDMGVDKQGRPIHRIGIRPSRGRTPMRTRIFDTSGESEFSCVYNAKTRTGDGIAEYYAQWREGGFEKMPLPK